MPRSPTRHSPSFRQPKISHTIKPIPLRECPQLKTIPTTASTSSSSTGKCYATTKKQISTGSFKMILRQWPQTRASLPSGWCSSWWSSTFQPLQELKWTGYSLSRVDSSAAHAIGVSIAVIMAWGLWKSLASALLYIDVSVRPSSEALFFFGHLLTRFNVPQTPLVRQVPPTAVSSSIDLIDALEALLELDV
jgi:hypothetical protein